MFMLAWKHLISRKRQTTLTLLGILFGSTAFVVISGFFLGFQGFLLDQLVNNDAHVRVSAREDFLEERSLDREFFPEADRVFWRVPPSGAKNSLKIDNPIGWYDLLSEDPRVVAYSPQLAVDVIFTKGPIFRNGRLIGCESRRQMAVTNIRKYMVEGSFEETELGGNRVVLGDGIMKKIGALVGDTILVSQGQGDSVPFKIVGRFLTGVKTMDDSLGYAHLDDAQALAGRPDEVTDIAIRLRDFQTARGIAAGWTPLMPDKVESWDQINASFLNVFKIQNATRYLVIAVILLVAGFGIYNILHIVVTQKQREIAILRSMGFEQSDVLRLFLYQGLILGAIGSATGLVFGFLCSLGLERVPFGGGPLGAGSGYLEISFEPWIYARAFFFGLSCAALASFLPARSAGRLTPIEIIRSGTE